MRRLYNPYKKYREPSVVQRFFYHGFEVHIIDTGTRDMKYEYLIYPLGSRKALSTISSMRRRKWTRKYGTNPREIITDPTSHRFMTMALEYARMHVNELRCPFYLKDWH